MHTATTADPLTAPTAQPSSAQATRKRLGVWVVLFMAIFAALAWRLNASFWKEVK